VIQNWSLVFILPLRPHSSQNFKMVLQMKAKVAKKIRKSARAFNKKPGVPARAIRLAHLNP
jgi:hypothetical protein